MSWTFDDITKERIIPLRHVTLHIAQDPLNYVLLKQLEEESSFQCTSISRKADRGQMRTVGHMMTATLYLSFNVFSEIIPALIAMCGAQLPFAGFVLGGWGNNIAGWEGQTEIRFLDGTADNFPDNRLEWTYDWEGIAFRSRFILRTTGRVILHPEMFFD